MLYYLYNSDRTKRKMRRNIFNLMNDKEIDVERD